MSVIRTSGEGLPQRRLAPASDAAPSATRKSWRSLATARTSPRVRRDPTPTRVGSAIERKAGSTSRNPGVDGTSVIQVPSPSRQVRLISLSSVSPTRFNSPS